MYEYLIASGSDFRFDIESLAAGIIEHWPGTERQDPTGQVGELASPFLYLPSNQLQQTEVSFHRSAAAIALESPDIREAADVIAWVARAAPMPPDGSVLLIGWGTDEIALGPTTSAEELIAEHK